MPAREHPLKRQYPGAWDWAFEGSDPAYLRLTQDRLSRELTLMTRYPWTSASINHIVRALPPKERAAKADLGDIVSTTGDTLIAVPEPTPEEVAEEKVTVAQELITIRAEQRHLRQLAQLEARRRNLIQALSDGVVALPPPAPYVHRPVVHISDTPHTLIVQWSDLHAGQFVDPEFVGDRFNYDKFQLEESVQIWLDGIRKFLAIYRSAYPVTRIVPVVLGDMVHGSDMRESQKNEIDHRIGTIGRQTIYVGRLIAEVFRELAADVDDVTAFLLGGNHGRVGKYGVNDYTDNFDWMAYHNAKAWLSDVKNVNLVIPNTPTALFTLGAKTSQGQHGDAIRSWGESPANAVKRAVRMDAFVQQVIPDYSMLGHFHESYQFQAGGKTRVLMNGAWPGGDKFCVHCLKNASEPTQNVFLFHPERGIVASSEIALRTTQAPPSRPVDLDGLLRAG